MSAMAWCIISEEEYGSVVLGVADSVADSSRRSWCLEQLIFIMAEVSWPVKDPLSKLKMRKIWMMAKKRMSFFSF